MASSGSRTREQETVEEQMERMRLSEKESATLVVDDELEGDIVPSWALVGKVLHRWVLHVSTIEDALRSAWEPQGA